MDMKINNRNAGWGILLIAFGFVALADNFAISEWYKVLVLALAGMAAFIFYYRDRTDWVTLIPVYILWAGALITAVILGDFVNDDVIAVAVLPLIAIPFLFVYFRDKKNWWALIPAYILLLIAFVLLFTEVLGLGDEFIAIVLMPGFAIPFLYVYLKNKGRWWALIPAYVFILIGILITLDEGFGFGDEIIGPGILGGIGLPFLFVYFRNRENWWALIPSYVLLAIGTMVGLLEFNLLTDLAVPAYILLATAIPFFFVFVRNQENRWALIPGGITGVMGLSFLFGTDLGKYFIPAIMVLVGIWLLVRVIRK
jgi:hypothetical protein